jgi:hypothetical protein
MIRFYYHPTPNPANVALFLEEAGLPYEVLPVDTSKGEQHLPRQKSPDPPCDHFSHVYAAFRIMPRRSVPS